MVTGLFLIERYSKIIIELAEVKRQNSKFKNHACVIPAKAGILRFKRLLAYALIAQ